ncbi:MAG: 1-acyl-sn-glycerol-3-phosphate acyltransferase [Deltaproteobacteria bacterium]|nr:1-acyl-sn-glycerol-3-phosphate acyltransferase [Candidatus Zymogenaceae bacterium]
MINSEHLDNINLRSYSFVQVLLGRLLLIPNYHIFSRVKIIIENYENIPKDETVIFALNHTDRYNYWPFQYKMWRQSKGKLPYTTTWVKGEYYGNILMRKFFDWTNNIPVPSRGYLIREDFRSILNEKISQMEYRILRDYASGQTTLKKIGEEMTDNIRKVINYPRKVLSGIEVPYSDYIDSYYRQLMARVAEINFRALFDKNLNVIIFPEGTRSLTLGTGKTGIAHLALKSGKKVVPVGCNGSDRVYRGNLPWAKSGTIVYRVGTPIDPREIIGDIDRSFIPFSNEAEVELKDEFREFTQFVMERINELLDDHYRSLSPVTVV